MNLTDRQVEIFLLLANNAGVFFTAKHIASTLELSVRTIHSEIHAIKTYCKELESIVLDVTKGKGYRLRIIDMNAFKDIITPLSNTRFPKQVSDTKIELFLIRDLIFGFGYTKKETFTHKNYISDSSFYKALNTVKTLLINYNLKIIQKRHCGYIIVGSELDKRRLIRELGIFPYDDDPLHYVKSISSVYGKVADHFLKHKYSILDFELQNISSHVALTVYRVKSGYSINTSPGKNHVDIIESEEHKLAASILNDLLTSYSLTKHELDNEILVLTQCILGKSYNTTNIETQIEANDFVKDALIHIDKRFYINLSVQEDLTVFLVMHLIPLIYRARSRTQLLNPLSDEIKLKFPLAHDISLYFIMMMNAHFDVLISPDETSYLALYFNYGLEKHNTTSNSKKVLVITALRQSETTLIRHRILSWFPEQITELRFTSIVPSVQEFSKYDTVLTTEKSEDNPYLGIVVPINIFPDESDFNRINLSLNGFNSIDAILDKFSEQCFYYGNIRDKATVLDILIHNAAVRYDLDTSFDFAIRSREDIASTYFGNLIALPHPLSPLSRDTFVSVVVLDTPIAWDDTNKAQLIMLISIERNNPKAYQFWYYISEIVRNKLVIDELIINPTFETFIKIVKQSLIDLEVSL